MYFISNLIFNCISYCSHSLYLRTKLKKKKKLWNKKIAFASIILNTPKKKIIKILRAFVRSFIRSFVRSIVFLPMVVA